MRTQGFTWCVLSVIIVQLITGSTGLVCDTAVESLDLSCLLRWDCPHASPNITYTVQTKTQGQSWQMATHTGGFFLLKGSFPLHCRYMHAQYEGLLQSQRQWLSTVSTCSSRRSECYKDPWQDVPWCVWLSSRSCDVSQVFSNFELYNMIRLGVHLSPSSTVWIKPHKFDYSDFTFSPPSVSVSLKNDSMSVKVQFPCATNRRCSHDVCCPISKLIDPWTTVTLYNELNRSDNQSRTVWTQEVVSSVEFSGLSPGQNYCAVANFSFPTFSMAASPKSAPGCVETGSRSGMLPMHCVGIGLSFLFLLLFLTVFLRKPRRDRQTPDNPPKALATVQDADSLAPPISVPVDPCDIHLELMDDHSSIDSFHGFYKDLTSTIENKNSSQPLHFDPSRGGVYCYSGELMQTRDLDSGISNPALSHFYVETCMSNEN